MDLIIKPSSHDCADYISTLYWGEGGLLKRFGLQVFDYLVHQQYSGNGRLWELSASAPTKTYRRPERVRADKEIPP